MDRTEKMSANGGRPVVQAGRHIDGVVIGRLVRPGDRAEALVEYSGNPTGGPVSAVSTTTTTDRDVGREIALAFERGDPQRPIILGFIHQPSGLPVSGQSGVQVSLDGERLVLSADREIVLKCGRASITLTRAGKVLIRGAYLLSRSSGANRIKGGSVQIN